MAYKIIILVLFALTHQSQQENYDEDTNPFAEAAAEIMKSQNVQSLGSMVNNIMTGMATGDKEGDAQNLLGLMKGIGSFMGTNGQGLDSDLISNVIGMMGSAMEPQAKAKEESGGLDVMSLISTFGGILSEPGNAEKFADYVPLALQTMNAFFGQQAQQRAHEHESHAWMLPPMLEKAHVFFDLFMNSDVGRMILNTLGAEKIVKIFSDETGKFSYLKFVEMLENQSFRRHWIYMVTSRLGKYMEHYGDPKVYSGYVGSIEFLINTFLKSQNFPKSVYFDVKRPSQTGAVLVNYGFKKYLNMEIDSKQYVKPAFKYLDEVLAIVKKKGFTLGERGDSMELSEKLADTINLEVIEPLARVNRAYRFVKTSPKCDKYIMCMINRNNQDYESLPGLKMLLSRGSSFFASWMLSSVTGTSLITYYNIIIEESNCKKHYLSQCGDFHEEEIKVTTEYVHNEL